jgi:hypothetical protein
LKKQGQSNESKTHLGWILFGITLIGMIYFACPKNDTVDFRECGDDCDAGKKFTKTIQF